MVIKLISERKGEHIHERVFIGSDSDHLALSGTLVFRIGEWQSFGAALLLGASQMKGNLTVITVGDENIVKNQS